MIFRKFILTLLVFILTGGPSDLLANGPASSLPRKDLYNKISSLTGTSLLDAVKAVFDNNKMAKYRLFRYAEKKGTNSLEKGLEEEIKFHKQKCSKPSKKRILCGQRAGDLEKQLKLIKGLKKDISKNSKLKIYYNMLIFSYAVRHEVLADHYKKWQDSCSTQKHINSPKCKDSFYEIDILYELAKRLTQVAHSQSSGKVVSRKQKKNIRALAQRYQ